MLLLLYLTSKTYSKDDHTSRQRSWQTFNQTKFSCLCSLIRPHCLGRRFLSLHLKALGSATQGQARYRDSRAALGSPQDKRQLRQTYSSNKFRVFYHAIQCFCQMYLWCYHEHFGKQPEINVLNIFKPIFLFVECTRH